MIPRKMEFDDAAYACTRISGELASYITRTEFEELVDHLFLEALVEALQKEQLASFTSVCTFRVSRCLARSHATGTLPSHLTQDLSL